MEYVICRWDSTEQSTVFPTEQDVSIYTCLSEASDICTQMNALIDLIAGGISKDNKYWKISQVVHMYASLDIHCNEVLCNPQLHRNVRKTCILHNNATCPACVAHLNSNPKLRIRSY